MGVGIENSKKIIDNGNPFSFHKYFNVRLQAKMGKFNCSSFFKTPNKDDFEQETSYNKAAALYEENMKIYNSDRAFEQKDKGDGAYSYKLDITKKNKNHEDYYMVYGRIVNVYHFIDKFHKDGNLEEIPKYVVVLWDKSKSQLINFEMSMNQYSRKFIDKILSLNESNLTDVSLKLRWYEYAPTKHKLIVEVEAYDTSAKFNKVKVEGTFEIATYDEKTGYTSTPKGSAKDNKEYLACMETALKGRKYSSIANEDFHNFYSRLMDAWVENVLKPANVNYFESLDFEPTYETINYQYGELKFTKGNRLKLTPIGSTSDTPVEEPQNTKQPLPAADDLPF